MAPRKKKARRRSRGFSLINALEAYTYASILSEGVAGTSPWGKLTADTHIGMRQDANAPGVGG